MIQENFVSKIEQSIRANWDLPAFSDYGGATITYGKAAEAILRLHYIFKKNHLRKGDKICLIGKNSTHWAIVYLAAITYGAVIVPVLPDFHIDDFHHITNHSDARLLFVADSVLEKLEEQRMPELDGIFSLEDFELRCCNKRALGKVTEKADEKYLEDFDNRLTPSNFRLQETSNSDLAAIVYTSGTSGFSKGVMLQHNSLVANVRYAQNNIAIKRGDTILSFLPLAHCFGCAFDFLFPVCTGCHITFLGRIPSPKILVQALAEVRPRLILSVPLLIEKIYKSRVKPKLDKPAIKALTAIPGIGGLIYKKMRRKLVEVFGGNFIEIVIGGAALNREVEDFLKKIHFPFTIGYGMTECGPLISYTPSPNHRSYAVGLTMNTLETRIDTSMMEHKTDDETDRSPNKGGSGEIGEIQVRGENVMMGYYKNDEAAKAAIDPDGWLHTGDMGYIDKDGYIYIKGRLKSILLGSSGQNIYPEEIEAKINNLPYVEESLVIEKENKIVALIYPNMEALDAEGLKIKDLPEKMEENRKNLNRLLPAYSQVAAIELYPSEFEKTPTKKIKRYLYTLPFEDKKNYKEKRK